MPKARAFAALTPNPSPVGEGSRARPIKCGGRPFPFSLGEKVAL
jgi:hypothetical protein